MKNLKIFNITLTDKEIRDIYDGKYEDKIINKFN